VQEWFDASERTLHTNKELSEIYRAQGASEFLKRILDLKKAIRSHQKDVSEGRAKPLELK